MADRGYRGRPQRGERADRQINAGHKLYGCRINGRRPVPVRI